MMLMAHGETRLYIKGGVSLGGFANCDRIYICETKDRGPDDGRQKSKSKKKGRQETSDYQSSKHLEYRCRLHHLDLTL
jgi:hypothetical protein